jgi:N6-L-threonylcarbamoyladenine synthase
MTARMHDEKNMDFPFLSVVVTGGHTEIVLTRGVGLHTVMGFTVDVPVGNYLDKVA